MVQNFYCQLDFEHVPYLMPGRTDGNVANNGCGICCASMMIEGMLGVAFPPDVCAPFSKRCGAREQPGTNFYILGGALAGRFDLFMRPETEIDKVVEFLRENPDGMAIANVRGDREGYVGVFSDGGHYVLLEGVQGDELCVLDPMYRPGRYDVPGRAGKVRMEGFRAYADKGVLKEDCFERPFFLYRKMRHGDA